MSTNVDLLIPKTKGVLIGATVFLWINFVVQLADIGLSANLLANPYENYYDYYDGFYDTLDFSGSATAAVAVCAVNLIFVIVPAIYCTIITVQFAKFARCPSDLQARPNRAHGIALTVLAVLQLIVGIAGIGVAATFYTTVVGGGVLSLVSGSLLVAAGILLLKISNTPADSNQQLPTHTLPMTGYAASPGLEPKYSGLSPGASLGFVPPQPSAAPYMAPQAAAPLPNNPLFSHSA